MTWLQLTEVHQETVDFNNYCLRFTQKVFGAPARWPSAWSAWLATTKKHEDWNFPDVAVPVWFSWRGDIDGTGVKDWGHVATRFPDGRVLSSPPSGYGQKWFNSVEEQARQYGCTYVGWSEDLNGLRITKNIETPKPTTKGKKQMYIIGDAETGAHYLVKDNDFIWIENNDDLDLLKRVLKSDPSKPDTFLGIQLDMIKKYLVKNA